MSALPLQKKICFECYRVQHVKVTILVSYCDLNIVGSFLFFICHLFSLLLVLHLTYLHKLLWMCYLNSQVTNKKNDDIACKQTMNYVNVVFQLFLWFLICTILDVIVNLYTYILAWYVSHSFISSYNDKDLLKNG